MTRSAGFWRNRTIWQPIVLALALGAAAPAWAQAPVDRPLPLGHITPNPTIIRGQIRLGLEYLRQAVKMLPSVGDPASLAQARQLGYDGYVMVRFAVNGVREQSKVTNPLAQIQDDAMERVRVQLRSGMVELDRVAAGQGDRVAPAEADFRAAIDGLEVLLAEMP